MFKELIKRAAQRIAATSRRECSPGMEVVYQNIFNRDLERFGLANHFYPVAGAANYSLLYLIMRICSSLEIGNIVELGAGQSSLLLNDLASKGVLNAKITTVEHDTDWANRLKPKISHDIICCNLTETHDEAGTYMGYDFDSKVPKLIDLLLIDGPPATHQSIALSRHGALRLLDNISPEGCIIIIDDAERHGEDLLAKRFAKAFDKQNIKYRQSSIVASKKQVVFATGRLLEAGYY